MRRRVFTEDGWANKEAAWVNERCELLPGSWKCLGVEVGLFFRNRFAFRTARMHERFLPASPNWYCSRCSDVNSHGVLGFGAKNTVYLLKVSASSAAVLGRKRL